ncbi:MAG: hypothetical protein WAR78_00400 [Ferruginibacter sp.]
MMKKIKSIKQLKAEKQRLLLQQQELEDRMRGNWSAVKAGLSPANIAKDTMGSIFKGVTNLAVNKEGIIKGAIALGIGFLAKKIAKRAGARLKKVFTK